MKKFFYFFNKDQKRKLIILFSFMFVSTFFEMIGLGFIFSIVGALSPVTNNESLFINKLGSFFELEKTEIFTYFLLFFLLFYIIKIIFLTFYNWYESNFLYLYKEHLSAKLFKEYLNQDFDYFYNRNSSEFIRNLITEAGLFILYLTSILKLALELVVVVGIFIFLAYINLYFTTLISTVLLFFSFLYFFLLKEKLNSWGLQRQSNIQKQIQFMQEGFDGIRIIKLWEEKHFF